MWEKSKGTTKYEKRTVTCDVGTAKYGDGTVKYEKTVKEPPKCEKITIRCDVGNAQCEDGIIKCEEKN